MAKYGKGIAPKDIARERIEILMRQAEACKDTDSARAARYVGHARDIATKQRVRLTRREKRSFCHHCGTYLVPGTTSRVRIARGRVSITCTVCGSVVRIPLSKKIKE
ncbi:MAG TPA: ribonuclease P [Methanocorpusculum sp.]|nr:ribonuclease P [Methanocorpusculum sp.]